MNEQWLIYKADPHNNVVADKPPASVATTRFQKGHGTRDTP